MIYVLNTHTLVWFLEANRRLEGREGSSYHTG